METCHEMSQRMPKVMHAAPKSRASEVQAGRDEARAVPAAGIMTSIDKAVGIRGTIPAMQRVRNPAAGSRGGRKRWTLGVRFLAGAWLVSLAPGFSRVSRERPPDEPFQRFLAPPARQPLKRLPSSSWPSPG